ncbi:hypothetical protein I553_8401 [Mycobacterium xenopi 4042]|uniref:Uncharacterized protein n=1 Tax=Mycobacterium xenopi 4042 TaxID=1299334 RepID=X8EY83_MYCXE|nr:hypothetical protein I553_8401 [Mycobacterium xenopi 4042]
MSKISPSKRVTARSSMLRVLAWPHHHPDVGAVGDKLSGDV